MEQIERDALDGDAHLGDALLKCVALGGHARSAKLRDWANHELCGYEDGPDVPGYRRIVAPIVVDGFSGNMHVTGQQISTLDLPDVAQKVVDEELALRAGVGELEDLVRVARSKGDPIRLGVPGGAELAKLMNHELQGSYRAVERIYWSVSPTAVVGVLGQIRSRLVALIAEVRAAADNPDEPSAEAISAAVDVVVLGKARDIHINTAQTSGPGAAMAGASSPADRSWWKRARVVGAFIVGAAGIAGTIIAWLQWKP
ncbi:MAG: hypothetical protein ACRDHS_02600 [Actinomycetota bacterium]